MTSLKTQLPQPEQETTDMIKQENASLFVKQEESLDRNGNNELKRFKPEPDALTARLPSNKRLRHNPNQIAPYDDLKEIENSKLAVDQPCFEEAEKLIAVISDMVLDKADTLMMNGYEDDEIRAICQRLRSVRAPTNRYPLSKPVGFLGDTAAGKSSLINCLLNQENVAAECDDGVSGTHVIQEFAHADPDQSDKYKAIVYYHPARKIEALIKKHFRDIFDFLHLNKEDLDDDEAPEYEARYATALEFFTSLLCSREDFRTFEAAVTYFNEVPSALDEDKIGQLKADINRYLESLGRIEGATILTADSLVDLNRKIRKFSGPAKSPEDGALLASPWPLVSKITVHMQARILRDGLVLADLPGVSDMNQTRVEATREYMKKCGTVVIAHPAPRVLSHDTVHTNLVECSRSGKLYSTVVVCTKTDDIKHDRNRPNLSKQDQQVLDELSREAQTLQEEVEELQYEVSNADDENYRALDRELKKKIQDRAAALARYREENIMIRNRRLVDGLQEKFKKIICAEYELPVFCVSNWIYQQHMKGYDNSSPPDLTVYGTDIPRLRQYLYEMPATRKLGVLMKLCKISLPAVLLAVELQCSKTRLERKQEIEARVREPLTKCKQLLQGTVSVLKGQFERCMRTVIVENENEWKDQAKDKHMKWISLKYARYAAFCRHNGVWRTVKKGPKIDWNDTINEISAADMLGGFSGMKATINDTEVKLGGELDLLLESLSTELKESPELMGLALEPFHELIEVSRQHVDERIRALFRKVDQHINNIRHDATSIESGESYVWTCMQPTYEQCKNLSGTGSHKARVEVMTQKLTGPTNIFLDVVECATTAFDGAVNQWASKAYKQLCGIFEEILTDFNRRFDNVEAEDETKRSFRRELLATVREARGVMDTKMKVQLDACASYR